MLVGSMGMVLLAPVLVTSALLVPSRVQAQDDAYEDAYGDADEYGDHEASGADPDPAVEATAASETRAEGRVSLGGSAQGDASTDSHGLLMVRVGVGAGYSIASTASRVDATFRGLSLSGQAALGLKVADNLVLHAEGFAAVMPMATLSLAARNRTITLTDDQSAMAYMAGLGLTHWLQPGDIFLSATVGPAWLRLEPRDIEFANLQMGVGVNLNVGKTFWLMPNVGLNLGLFFNYMAIPNHAGANTAVLPNCDAAEGGDCSDISKHRFGVSTFGFAASIVYH